MSRAKELERRLDAVLDGIEALDAGLEAGRLDADEHRRRRTQRELEAGRLLASLRQARRQGRVEPARVAAPRPTGPLFRPLAIAAAGVLLVGAGVGGGLAFSRWLGAGERVGVPGTGPTAPAEALRSLSSGQIPLQTLRPLTANEDAPIPTQLQLAHDALDQGRLDEAREVYGRVLRREPRNAEAITHLGAVLYQEGRIDEALAKVEEALRIDPAYIHAHWDRTQYLFHGKRDYPATIVAGEAFLRVVPDGPDASNIRSLMVQARELGARNAPLIPKPR